MYFYLLPFSGNSYEDAEEVIQDTFVKVWTRRETLPAIDNFPSYLFKMARNRFPDGQKKRKITSLPSAMSCSRTRNPALR
ncbi:MAG: hypothetical protein KGM16_00855 [Bacteroidota bacterium]|nr:hypothetical protein [Bacteroidota bacterium]